MVGKPLGSPAQLPMTLAGLRDQRHDDGLHYLVIGADDPATEVTHEPARLEQIQRAGGRIARGVVNATQRRQSDRPDAHRTGLQGREKDRARFVRRSRKGTQCPGLGASEGAAPGIVGTDGENLARDVGQNGSNRHGIGRQIRADAGAEGTLPRRRESGEVRGSHGVEWTDSAPLMKSEICHRSAAVRASASGSPHRWLASPGCGRPEAVDQAACNSSLRILRSAAAVSGLSSATFPFVLPAASRRAALIIV